MKEPIRESGIIYHGFYQQINDLKVTQQAYCWRAICELVFYDNDIGDELTGMTKTLFNGFKKQIIANINK